jgi:hypothetical protein
MDAIAPMSPYLPGTKIQYAWDSTSLSNLKTCPRLYQLINIEGWEPKDKSIHLRFGIEYHEACQDYELLRAANVDHDAAVHETVRCLLVRIQDWNPDVTTRAGEYKNKYSLLQLVVDYLDYYRDDPAKTVILENGKPAVELSFRIDLSWGPRSGETGKDTYQPYVFCGHLDRVATFAGEYMILDKKTTTYTLGPYWFNQWSPNNQMTGYTFAGRTVYQMPIRGVVIEGAQIMKEEPNRFVRGITYRTDDQLQEWLSDLQHWLDLAEGYARMGYWPMNDTSCAKYGGCQFQHVCSKNPNVRSQFLKADFNQLEEQDRWNPLRNR